jgi:diguanylate cyclase (GGDEF)-like protein
MGRRGVSVSMNDSSTVKIAWSTTGVPALEGAGTRGWGSPVRHPAALVLAIVAAFLVCGIHAAVAGADTRPASGIGYLCQAFAMWGCFLAFWFRSRTAQGTLYMRWTLIAAGALAAAIGLVPSFTQEILHTAPARQLQTACFNASEALYMLAAVLFFAGGTRAIVFVDTLQALLFIVLRFNLVYSPWEFDNFRMNHLLINQLVALFLFTVATIACLGAASRAELKFLRTLSWFFGIRTYWFFLSDQVSYIWLRHIHCSLWDVPGVVLLSCFSMYLVFGYEPRKIKAQAARTPHARSVVVRSLMPSFMAMVNLMLSLFLLPISLPLAAGAISASLIFYVVRTALLQGQAVEEKAHLEKRNEQLEGLATRDPLTGIGNRRSLAEAYQRLQAAAGGEGLSLLAIDIDHFKQANDRYGHLHGDTVLVALARMLENLPAGGARCHCARLGGDEFAVLLPGVSSDRAGAWAEELRVLFGSHEFAANSGWASLSIGVASLTAARDLPLELLISYADQALYRAKEMGRDRVEAMPTWQPGISLQDSSSLKLGLKLQHTAG